MIVEFLGIRVEGDLPENELRLLAVREAIKIEFQAVSPAGSNPPPLEDLRSWALSNIKKIAKKQRSDLDDIVSDNITLANEIVIYYLNDRPADPQPGVYVIADAIATRRGVTLRTILENLLTRWQAIQADIANVMPELDRLLDEVDAATTIEEIETALASATWPLDK